MKLTTAILTSLIPLGAACVEAPPLGTDDRALAVPDGVQLWTTRGNVIPLCWLTAGEAATKAFVRDTIARTWASAALLDVRWRDTCPTTGTEAWVRVALKTTADGNTGGRATVGVAAASRPNDQVWCSLPGGGQEPCRGMDLTLNRDLTMAANRRRSEYLVIHEFGHVLGFGHEQDRVDAPACMATDHERGLLIGPYDPASIMNYCDTDAAQLSEGDVVGAQAVYGRPAARADALADLDGDGLADPIATNRDGTYALQSTGFGFAGWRKIAGPFYGQRATAYADLDADGRADAIAVNDNAIFTLRSNGTTLDRWAMWTDDAFYGQRRTLIGDVDGDGRADVVAVNHDGTCLRRAAPGGFVDHACWVHQSFGALATDLADVTGDGRADLIANQGPDGIWVRAARDPAGPYGAGFELGFEPWSFDAFGGLGEFRADRELAFGDVDGDGRADALAVRFDGIFVRRSTGAGFSLEERWGTGLGAGVRANRFADVTGDGRVDLIEITGSGDQVRVSDGSMFVPFGAPWTAGPFYTLP